MEDVSHETTEPILNGRNPDGTFTEGNPGGPGRPKGSVSPITRVKQLFQEKPELFEGFVSEYITDPQSRRHIVEMIDGKPHQATDITSKGEKIMIMPAELINKNEEPKELQG